MKDKRIIEAPNIYDPISLCNKSSGEMNFEHPVNKQHSSSHIAGRSEKIEYE